MSTTHLSLVFVSMATSWQHSTQKENQHPTQHERAAQAVLFQQRRDRQVHTHIYIPFFGNHAHS